MAKSYYIHLQIRSCIIGWEPIVTTLDARQCGYTQKI
jgi:hypothetical protein